MEIFRPKPNFKAPVKKRIIRGRRIEKIEEPVIKKNKGGRPKKQK